LAACPALADRQLAKQKTTNTEQQTVNARLPEPLFEELAGGFQVTLFKSSEKSLTMITSNPEITSAEMAQMLEITKRVVEKVLAKLKSEEKLKRIGPAKGGHWEIIEK
jgi:ATP-dependent DNA helicase RecG